jgi:hypothetical protein
MQDLKHKRHPSPLLTRLPKLFIDTLSRLMWQVPTARKPSKAARGLCEKILRTFVFT